MSVDGGFAKLYGRILGSSLMDEEPMTRLVFILLLAKADRNGRVDATYGALARVFNLPKAVVFDAIAALCEPDPESRTSTHDGRRLTPIEGQPWGWDIVTYADHRAARDRTESNRAYYLRRRIPELLGAGLDAEAAKLQAELEAIEGKKPKTVSVGLSQIKTAESSESGFSHPQKTEVQSKKKTEESSSPDPQKDPTKNCQEHGSRQKDDRSWTWKCRNGEWELTRRKFDEWVEAFPDLDVRYHLRMARQWLRDNPHRLKKVRGMPAFLGNWLRTAEGKRAERPQVDDTVYEELD